MEVSSFFLKAGVIVAKDALDYIASQPDPETYAVSVLEANKGKRFLTLEDVKLGSKVDSVKEEKEVIEVRRPSDFKPLAKDVDPDLKVYDEYNITGKSRSTGDISDFLDYFRNRFEKLSRILRERGPAVKDIETLKKVKYTDTVRVIGMVYEKRVTKNGHTLIIIEDPTDQLTVLVPKDNEALIAKAASILPDEVIAVEGKFSRRTKSELFIASDIIQPDIPPKHAKTANEDIALAMLSDTHVGSNLFLEKTFRKFLNWINGNGPRKDLAGRVKYITIAGDLVDGVGVYPGQEEELAILDIYQQYEAFERLMEEIPEYIEVIIIPGNHDAVRVADPQPAIPRELLPDLYNLDNFHILGSPSMVSLHGVDVLLYHGQSIHSYVPYLSGFDYTVPERFGIEALKRRHLHVVYGDKPPLAPEKEDFLVIERVPDIIHVGDVHRNGYAHYKGVTIVNSGTWQDITPFQIKQGHHPTPGNLPVITLMDRRLNVLKFRRGDSG